MKIELFDSEFLNIVELNTTGDNENYIKGDSESKYLESEVFNLFASCFEKANKLYEFFGATKYNARNIVPLRNELNNKLESVKEINSFDMFNIFLKNVFLGSNFIIELEKDDKNWKKNWKKYLMLIIDVIEDVVKLIEKCIEEQRVLWVIGY
ncbi:MAG: hypothetical protein PF487_05035 [Bacteroidales bacterium]|jgi:hypothetical protein|nr:hypothetical protein [Bacteroidales bacterium]